MNKLRLALMLLLLAVLAGCDVGPDRQPGGLPFKFYTPGSNINPLDPGEITSTR